MLTNKRPVTPEAVKRIYRSSVSEGINLALFDSAKAAGRAVSLYNITKVTVKVDAA